VILCVGYLRLVIGRGPALIEAAVAQAIFLVLFSYSFFFEGLTGLAVTIGSVATLGYYMAKTAKVDWDDVFKRMPRPNQNRSANWAPPVPPQTAAPAPADGYGFGPNA
jgi:hypothetical protein